jgi:ubiquinone/menaquinone biosynthesis C-methylase UbiE
MALRRTLAIEVAPLNRRYCHSVNIIPSPAPSRINVAQPWRPGYGTELYDTIAAAGIDTGRTILDLACGTGNSTEPLAVRGCIVTGLDLAQERLAVAQERLPNLRFVHGRAEELPFDDDSFDGAVCAQAFHHFDQPKAMAQLIRVVRPGGSIAIWWAMLSSTDRVRAAREVASLRAGRSPIPDSLKGGFKAFFAAPLAERRMRVLRHVVFTTVDQWMVYERSRRRAAEHYGERYEQYLTLLENELHSSYGNGEMQATFIQYLYIGRTA